ncbi:MAG: DUF3422 domain-containing protein [Verrucomicrobiota bacterium]
MNATDPERFHPQYRELHAELLARPFPVVSGQVMVSHRAILFTPGEATAHRAAVTALADFPEVVATPEEQGFQLLRLGEVELRIERHTEFTTFTVFAPQAGMPFAESAMDQLPEGWLDAIPGRILAAVEIASELIAPADAGTTATMERVLEYFDNERLVGGWVVERVASVWSHFRPDERGATRFLVQIHRLTSGRYGRLVQRLVEIENYRMAAMLSLPLARELLPQVEELEARHVSLVERIGVMHDGDERALLGDLTNLSLATERLQARCGSRFSLTESYARILSARVREMGEEQVPGYQTLGEFFDRRLAQAWHTCERAEAGLAALSVRLQSTTGLLRTRVDVNLQSQNHLLLASVDRRAAAQLKLQHNVEGLSVVVLTYYLANLIKIALEGTKASGVHFDSSLVVTLLLPLLAYGVWRVVRNARNENH